MDGLTHWCLTGRLTDLLLHWLTLPDSLTDWPSLTHLLIAPAWLTDWLTLPDSLTDWPSLTHWLIDNRPSNGLSDSFMNGFIDGLEQLVNYCDIFSLCTFHSREVHSFLARPGLHQWVFCGTLCEKGQQDGTDTHGMQRHVTEAEEKKSKWRHSWRTVITINK